jgi:undecaprenol kinase
VWQISASRGDFIDAGRRTRSPARAAAGEGAAVKNQPFRERLTFAWAGVRFALANERSLRAQVWIAALLLLGLAALRPPALWWALCVLSAALVLTAELINTALERLIDRVHPERHEDIRIVKDCAAAAVLCASVAAAVVAVLTLFARVGWI